MALQGCNVGILQRSGKMGYRCICQIGYFAQSDADLKYLDEMNGSLIEQVDKTIDLVYTKYMKALISYEGIQRIEQFMV